MRLWMILLLLSVHSFVAAKPSISLPFDGDFSYLQTVEGETQTFEGHLTIQEPHFAFYEIPNKMTLVMNDKGSWYYDQEFEEIFHQSEGVSIPVFTWLMTGKLPEGASHIKTSTFKHNGQLRTKDQYSFNDSSMAGNAVLIVDENGRLVELTYFDAFDVEHQYQFHKHSSVQHKPSYFLLNIPEGMTITEVS